MKKEKRMKKEQRMMLQGGVTYEEGRERAGAAWRNFNFERT